MATSSDNSSAIHGALRLRGNPAEVASYYRTWATTYDRDVGDQGYRAPEFIGELFRLLYPYLRNLATVGRPRVTTVLDAGCGTGLAGRAIADCPDIVIDGIDLSHEMVAKAARTGAYRTLRGGVDMHKSLDVRLDTPYDATISCGVYTPGHVRPESLGHLFEVTRRDGIVLVSTRNSYLEESDFTEYVDELLHEERAELLCRIRDAPYIAEEPANYWAFRVIR